MRTLRCRSKPTNHILLASAAAGRESFTAKDYKGASASPYRSCRRSPLRMRMRPIARRRDLAMVFSTAGFSMQLQRNLSCRYSGLRQCALDADRCAAWGRCRIHAAHFDYLWRELLCAGVSTGIRPVERISRRREIYTPQGIDAAFNGPVRPTIQSSARPHPSGIR